MDLTQPSPMILNKGGATPYVLDERHALGQAYAATRSSRAGRSYSRSSARSAHLEQIWKDRLKRIAHRSWADGAILGVPSYLCHV